MFKKKKKDEPIEKTVITQVTSLPADTDKKAYILFLSGPLVGKLINLQEGSTVIGRADDADISINDIRISRHHLKIDIDEGRVQVEDLGSTNGTFINGTKVKRGKLEDGDKIQISSSTIFKFALQDRAENVFHKELYKMAVMDPVTNIYNKRFFIERFKEEFSHARRSDSGLSLLMIDIDFFKKVNDTYGHLTGDMVLHQIASILAKMVRNEDILARYGGEEFVIILRGAKKEGAYILAERMRLKIAAESFIVEKEKIPVTISIGVASMEEGGKDLTTEKLIKMADVKLYKSKKAGRNKTTS